MWKIPPLTLSSSVDSESSTICCEDDETLVFALDGFVSDEDDEDKWEDGLYNVDMVDSDDLYEKEPDLGLVDVPGRALLLAIAQVSVRRSHAASKVERASPTANLAFSPHLAAALRSQLHLRQNASLSCSYPDVLPLELLMSPSQLSPATSPRRFSHSGSDTSAGEASDEWDDEEERLIFALDMDDGEAEESDDESLTQATDLDLDDFVLDA